MREVATGLPPKDSVISSLRPPRSKLHSWIKKSKHFWLDNWKRLWILFLWLGALAALFTWKFVQYRHRSGFDVMGYCLCVAKGAAETLKLNMALILLPMCRNTLTWARSTWLSKVIPFDSNLQFHKVWYMLPVNDAFIHAQIPFHNSQAPTFCSFSFLKSWKFAGIPLIVGRGISIFTKDISRHISIRLFNHSSAFHYIFFQLPMIM